MATDVPRADVSQRSYAQSKRHRCGSKLSRRGNPQALVHASAYQGNPFWYRFFELQPNECWGRLEQQVGTGFRNGERQIIRISHWAWNEMPPLRENCQMPIPEQEIEHKLQLGTPLRVARGSSERNVLETTSQCLFPSGSPGRKQKRTWCSQKEGIHRITFGCLFFRVLLGRERTGTQQ